MALAVGSRGNDRKCRLESHLGLPGAASATCSDDDWPEVRETRRLHVRCRTSGACVRVHVLMLLGHTSRGIAQASLLLFLTNHAPMQQCLPHNPHGGASQLRFVFALCRDPLCWTLARTRPAAPSRRRPKRASLWAKTAAYKSTAPAPSSARSGPSKKENQGAPPCREVQGSRTGVRVRSAMRPMLHPAARTHKRQHPDCWKRRRFNHTRTRYRNASPRLDVWARATKVIGANFGDDAKSNALDGFCGEARPGVLAQVRIMSSPPWLPTGGVGPFHAHRTSEAAHRLQRNRWSRKHQLEPAVARIGDAG